jgi:hypothetical protein
MKTKTIYKIGLSLLIALALILPSGSFMASSIGKQEADNNRDFSTTEPKIPGLFSQLDPVNFGGLHGENGEGDFFDIEEDVTIPLDCYDLWVTMLKPDQIDAEGKPHIEIYKLEEGLHVTMYETSFEDNFDIYNNWIQIDQDCAVMGGHYDSWTWSDARASDGDHSFKSTMYDIYKGNQDDYLVLRQEFDVCDQYAVIVYFDVWAEGDYDDSDNGILTPYDFASFEIGDGTTWIENLTLDEEFENEYKFFDTTLPLYSSRIGINVTANVEDIGDGWWRVMYRVNMSELAAMGLDCSTLQFRFDWHSDPQFQFEGAYIDNFKIISVESEMEKIYQGHSQGPIDIVRHEDMFKFPLEWCPEEGCYRAIVWLEILDIDHESTFDWPGVEIDFCVGDNIDCEITDLMIEDSFTLEIVGDGEVMTEGSDAHIVYEFHNGGNIPMEDIEVTATANKFTWETEFETDFEVTLSPMVLTGEVHLSTEDSFSGEKSLFFADKDTMEYTTHAFWYAYTSDISLEGVEEMYFDYYWKANTDPGDFVAPATIDNYANTLLGSGYANTYGTDLGGLEPDWIGPTENAGKYTRMDVLALFDHYYALGYLRDYYGEPLTEIPLGFFLTTDDDEFNRHPDSLTDDYEIYWSGVFVDDVKITSKKIGEEVWTETMIIPGPIEPCETYEAQFEWEDVTFSNYEICVEAICEGDIDPEDNEMCQQILVLDNLEHATLKEIESVDYTDECEEGWGICSSDYDNYLSTNPDDHFYASDSNAVVELCPDGDSCINISHLDIHDPPPTITQHVNEGFDGSWPAGWNNPGARWFWGSGNQAGGVAAGQAVVTAASIAGFTNAYAYTPVFSAVSDDYVNLSFTWAASGIAGGPINFQVQALDGTWGTIWSQVLTTGVGATPSGIIPLTTGTTQLRFRITGYNSPPETMNWVVFDDVLIEGIEYHTAPDNLEIEFDAWWDIEDGWDYVYLEVYDGCPALFASGWQEVKNWTNNSFAIGDDDGWYHELIDLEPFVSGDNFTLRFRLDSDSNTEGRGFIIDNLQVNDGIFGPDPMDNMSNWCVGCQSVGDYWDDWCIDIPDAFIDNALIWSTEINDAYEAYLIVDHNYTFQNAMYFIQDLTGLVNVDVGANANFDNYDYAGSTYSWGLHAGPGAGNLIFWAFMGALDYAHSGLRTTVLDLTTSPAGVPITVQVYDRCFAGGTGSQTQMRAVNADGSDVVVIEDFGDSFGGPGGWSTKTYTFDANDLADPANAYVEAYVNWNGQAVANLWQFGGMNVYGATVTAVGYLEISTDGGDSWHALDMYTGTSGGDITDTYDITPFVGNDILVRFRVEGNDDSTDDRFWCINDIMIAGKTDETAPSSSATMSGTMKESGWYTTNVKVTITAEDIGAGMGEIHYIVDGSESVVAGDVAEFTVSGNGEHNIEFWAVDAMGNEETPHNTIPTFRIDSGAAPSVSITAPEPGLYLFGNKLLSASKVIIIGAFTVEATASDAESGIYRVQFYLDGDLVSEDTEVPFSAYIAEKHMGAGTIKVVAEDFAQNTAEDTLDITYYKFL